MKRAKRLLNVLLTCLEELRWVVIRCIQIGNATYEYIYIIVYSGHNGRITRKTYCSSIENANSNRVMKYKHSSTPHPNWLNEGICSNFLKGIKTQVSDKILNGVNYIVGKYNLIKINGDEPSK